MSEEEVKGKEEEVENRARLMGWIPPDEFKGEKENFISAEEFVERGEKLMPLLKAQNRKYEDKLKRQESELGATKAEIQELRSTMKKVIKASAAISEREYNRALETIRKEQEAAVESGDTEKWRKLEKQRDELKPPEKEVEPEPKAPTEPPPVFVEWTKENDWYAKDTKMRAYADSIGQVFAQENPLMPYEELLAKVAEDVKERFPEKFKNPAREKPSAVDGGGTRGGGTAPKKRSYESLPKDAKKACDELVADGVLTKEQYVQYYDWDE